MATTEKEQQLTEDKINSLRAKKEYNAAHITPFFNNRYALVRKGKGKVYKVYSLLSCKFMKVNKNLFVNLTRVKGEGVGSYLLKGLVTHALNNASITPLTDLEIEQLYKDSYQSSMLSELLKDSEDVFSLPFDEGVFIQYDAKKGKIAYKEIRHTTASNGRLEAHFIATVYNDNDGSVINKSLPWHFVKGCYLITDIDKVSDIVKAELRALL